MGGIWDILDIEAVSNVLQMDEYFLASIDLNESIDHQSPAVNYLDRDSYVTSDEIVEGIHPYVFFKVQTHSIDNSIYKDIVRLPEEEKNM